MNVMNKKSVFVKRINKLSSHYNSLKDYKLLIENLLLSKDIYEPVIFTSLKPEERAILDAYLKRFSSIQDYLGSKIFPMLLEIAGISSVKMSEVLYNIEKEGIIDSFDSWVEIREIRNELEHDYPDELEDALSDLKFCVDNYDRVLSYYLKSIEFAKRYIDEII